MRRQIEELIPSMFNRRLGLLLVVATLTVGGLCLQMIHLTVARGGEHRSRAESRLREKRTIPTVRGRILDRHNRVIAQDEPSYDLAIHYDLLTNNWVDQHVRTMARRRAGSAWAILTADQRQAQLDEARRALAKSVEEMWVELGVMAGVEGEELAASRAKVLERVQQLATTVWMRWQQEMSARMDEELSLGDVASRVREQSIAHVVLEDLSDEARLAIQRRITASQDADLPDPWQRVSVRPGKKRVYPFETQRVTLARDTLPQAMRRDEPVELAVQGVGMHLLGITRKIMGQELAQPRWEGYAVDDRIGAWGVERAEEARLRGQEGYEIRNRETGQVRRQDPQLGQDIVLSVDIALQARIQAIMDQRPVEQGGLGLMRYQQWRSREHYLAEGTPLNGSAVVLDVAQGQVLAAVSVPTITLAQLRGLEKVNLSDPVNLPYLNRVVSMPLMPGSVVKPLVLAAALTDRVVGVHETIYCSGQHDPPHGPRCWIKNYFNGEHGPLEGSEAVARSCNVYFATVATRLGAKQLVSWYDRFGLGQPTRSGLEEEARGHLPDLARAGQPNVPGFAMNEGVQMSFGQGPVGWTPLQAANAYATLARGGYRVSPTFFKYADAAHEQAMQDIHLSDAAVAAALKGLHDSVYQDYGGGHHYGGIDGRENVVTFPGVTVYAKSGTAEAPKLRIEGQVVRAGDHAWFAAMVKRPGSARPDYVVIVVVEYGGSGAAVAGPVFNQILYALHAENYL